MAEALSTAQQLQEKVASLKTALLDKHPQMPILLREIHSTLKKYPEQVTVLSEEEVAVIVSGLMKQTGTEFAVAAQKGPGNKSAVSKIKALGSEAF